MTAGAAFDQFLRDQAPASADQPTWTPEHGKLPALYISHGAPPLFDDAGWMTELFDWSQSMPRPTAILIVSAHWEAAPLTLSVARAGTPLVYDFGGFDQRFFEMAYATPDATALAAQVASLMPDNEPVRQHRRPRLGPRRMGAAEGDVPQRRRARAPAQHADA